MLYLIAAGLKERIRSKGFVFGCALMLFLAYSVSEGIFTFHWGDYKPESNGAWEGWNAALFMVMFITLPGFYFVRSAIGQDIFTGVCDILAASGITNTAYIWSKVFCNAVYLIILFVLYAAGILVSLLLRPDSFVNVGEFLAPLFFIVFPVILMVASVAVFFETIPFLRNSLGNILYFLIWITLISLSARTKEKYSIDILGFGIIKPSILKSIEEVSNHNSGFWDMSLSRRAYELFQWKGIAWTNKLVMLRLLWSVPFLFLPFLSSLFFNRFSEGRMILPQLIKINFLSLRLGNGWEKLNPARILSTTPSPIKRIKDRSSWFYFFFNEMALLVKGHHLLWYLFMIWINAYALFFAKEYDLRYTAFPLTLILPIVIWSGMGFYENHFRVHQVLYVTNFNVIRSHTSSWLASIAISILLFSGLIIKAINLNDWHLILIMLSSVLLIPGVALFSGSLSHSRHLFEVLFIFCWYAGPVKDYYIYANLFFASYGELAKYLLVAAGISFLLVSLSGIVKMRTTQLLLL